MRQHIATTCVFCLMMLNVSIGARAEETQSAPRVAKHAGVFNKPPERVPTNNSVDGPILGNGDVGVVLAGPPESQTWFIGKNDFWSRARGCIVTVGGLHLSFPALSGASYHQEQDLYRAEVRGQFGKPTGAKLSTRSWVSANENLLVVEMTNEGAVSLQAVLDLFAGPAKPPKDSGDSVLPVTRGRDTDALWFTRRADCESVEEGRIVAVACRVLNGNMQADDARLAFEIEPGQTSVVVSAILTDIDSRQNLEAARERVKAQLPNDIQNLNKNHRDWWEAFWSASSIEIPDDVIEKHWYGALYIMASCSREGKVAPGLFANWITTDTPSWKGDFHLNYNYEAPFWGLFSANHVAQTACYDQPLLYSMAQARNNAHNLLDKRGVYYPVGIGPWGIVSDNTFWCQKSNAAYAAVNMIMRFDYTRALDYARSTAYPFLKEVADFWEDYLKFEDGRYVIYDDAIHESADSHDMNPILSLGLLRMLFASMIDMSTELGVDADRHEKWNHILSHMSDFPTQQRAGKTVFRYTEKGMAWCDSNTLGIQHIWPAGALGLDSPLALLQIARNTVDVLGRWDDNNGFATFYTAAARVGYDPKTILRHLREQCERHAFPSLYICYGGGGIESCGGIISAVNEMLLQSHENVIRVFPVWSRRQPARFTHLRAMNAFLVSSEYRDGNVQYVVIQSEKGRNCTVQNPWPGKNVALYRKGTVSEELDGLRFHFKTAPDERVILLPDGVPLDKSLESI